LTGSARSAIVVFPKPDLEVPVSSDAPDRPSPPDEENEPKTTDELGPDQDELGPDQDDDSSDELGPDQDDDDQ
jgi:hypothetical protein